LKKPLLLVVATLLLVPSLSLVQAAPVSASSGCGTTQDWHYISQAASYVLDGNSESFPTGVFAGSDWESTSLAWQLRVQAWGTQATENYLVNEFTPQSPYATPISGVSTVWMEGSTPSGSSLTFQSSLCPAASASSEGLWSIVLDSVPYVGSAIDALENNDNFGVHVLTETSYDNDIKWTGVVPNYTLPSAKAPTYAEEYQSYAQQMLVNAGAGYAVHTDGAVGYTTTYEPSRNDYLQSYDYSSTVGSTGDIESY